MNIQVYDFHELGSIPGVPGQFPAGMRVLLDTDTGTITDVQPVAETLAAIREGDPVMLPILGLPGVGDLPEQMPTLPTPGRILGPPIEEPELPVQLPIQSPPPPIQETI